MNVQNKNSKSPLRFIKVCANPFRIVTGFDRFKFSKGSKSLHFAKASFRLEDKISPASVLVRPGGEILKKQKKESK